MKTKRKLTFDEIEVLLRYASPKTCAKLTRMFVEEEVK